MPEKLKGKLPIPPEQLLERARAKVIRLGKQEARFKLTVEQTHMLLKRAHEGLDIKAKSLTSFDYLVMGGSAYHSLVAQLFGNQRGQNYYNAKAALDELMERQSLFDKPETEDE